MTSFQKQRMPQRLKVTKVQVANQFHLTNRSMGKIRLVSKQSIHSRKLERRQPEDQRQIRTKAVLKRERLAHKGVQEDYVMDKTRKLPWMLWQKVSKLTGRAQPRRTIR